MPQPIEANEEQHQNPNHHPAVPQLRISARPLVNMIKDLFKPEQIHKLDQPQKPAKRTKSLRAGPVGGGSRDSTGSTGFFLETFTEAIFRGSMKSLVNHLGYLLSMSWFSPNPIIIGYPDGFPFFIQTSAQDRGHNKPPLQFSLPFLLPHYLSFTASLSLTAVYT
jgi:hypothetical protein